MQVAGDTGRAVGRAATVESADVVVPRRPIHTGPLHVRPLEKLGDRPDFESRLPLLILLGLGVLVGVQVYLAL